MSRVYQGARGRVRHALAMLWQMVRISESRIPRLHFETSSSETGGSYAKKQTRRDRETSWTERPLAFQSLPFLPPQFLQAIGNLSAYWAYLESITEVIIWLFLDIPRSHGALLTTEIGMVSRVQALRRLAELRFFEDSPILKEFKEALGQIDQLRIRRNKYIHAFWRHEPNAEALSVSALRITAKGNLKQVEEQVSIDELQKLVDEVANVTDSLMAFAEVVFHQATLPWQRSESTTR